MGLVSEIMNQVTLEEISANKERYVGNAKEIRIHPEWFYKVMDDPEMKKSYQHPDGTYRLYGIPLIRTTTVEKWEIII